MKFYSEIKNLEKARKNQINKDKDFYYQKCHMCLLIRDTADGEGADQEQDRGMRHLLGEAAQLSEVGGARLMQDSTCAKEQEALEERVVHGVIEA